MSLCKRISWRVLHPIQRSRKISLVKRSTFHPVAPNSVRVKDVLEQEVKNQSNCHWSKKQSLSKRILKTELRMRNNSVQSPIREVHECMFEVLSAFWMASSCISSHLMMKQRNNSVKILLGLTTLEAHTHTHTQEEGTSMRPSKGCLQKEG